MELLRNLEERSERIELENKVWEHKDAFKKEKTRSEISASDEKEKEEVGVSSIIGEDGEEKNSLQMALEAVEKGIPIHRFEAHVAATLHDVWRMNRGKQADGGFTQRLKTIENVEYDIANLKFAELPGHLQMDNLLAAHDTCESIRRVFEEWETTGDDFENLCVKPESKEFLLEASCAQHSHWLKRNAKKAWVDECQKLASQSSQKKTKQPQKNLYQQQSKSGL